MKRSLYAALLALFFLSGATALVYEVTWTRMLTLVLGHTVHAVSTVLAAFMGGLALGSWLASRGADRLRRPLFTYALLEVGIGVFALVIPALLARLDLVFGPIYRGLGEHTLLFGAVRFLLCFALLLVPTVLMGATLPVLGHAAASVGSLGGRIGGLYAANTLGAVAGCFLTGFALLMMLGVHGTIVAAAFANFVIAAFTALLGAASPPAEPSASSASLAAATPDEQQHSPESSLTRWLPFVYGVSGFVALALEVTWTRGLIFSFFSGSSTYAFSTMLTVFLLGLGAGSLAAATIVDRLANRVRALAWGEIVLGAAALLSAPLLLALSSMHVGERPGQGWLGGIARDLGKSAAIMLVPTLAMGALFPILARVFIGSAARAGRGIGRLYFANTTGAILGSLAAGFLLVPRLGVGRSIVLLGCISLVLGAALAWSDLRATRTQRAGLALGALAAAIVLPFLLPVGRPIQQVEKDGALLFYEEGASGTVAVVQQSNGERRLQIDNVWIAGTNSVMKTAHKTLAHFGALLQPDPRRALAVGFASGGTSWSYTKHPEIERIDCVEIADTVLHARPYFTEVNGTVMEDPRFHVILEDARTFLLLGRDPYDLIATDCTDLRYKSDANLYTVEYFDLCKRRLADDGMLVVFLPFGGLSDATFRGVLGTFLHVFPDGSVWYANNETTHYLLLMGSRRPLQVDWRTFQERLAVPAVREDLAAIGLADPYRILSSFVASGADLAPLVRGASLNTVDLPWLEFRAPREDSPGMLDNLETILDAVPAKPPEVTGMSAQEKETLARYARTSRRIARGQIHATRRQADQARIEFEDALAELGKDRALQGYLGISDERQRALEKKAAGPPPDPVARYELAVLLRRRGDLAGSESMLRELLADKSLRFSAEMSLALTVEQAGRGAEGEQYYREALTDAADENQKRVAQLGLEQLQRRESVRAHPDDVQGVLDLAQHYARSRDLYQALHTLQRRVDERGEPQVLEALTALFLQAGMVERGQETAEQLVARRPDDPAAHYYLMDASLRLGRFDRAQEEFEASRKLDDKNFSLWFAGARLYCLRGLQDDCTAALRKALALGGAQLITLARQDPSLAASASFAAVEKEYLGAPAPPGPR